MGALLHKRKSGAPESRFRYSAFKTAQGWVAVLGSEKGIFAATLPHSSKEAALDELGSGMNDATPDDNFFSDIASRLKDYFAGKRVSFDDELDTSDATPFLAGVWQAAREITYGQTRSYGWLAAKAGKPAAARAVGQAMARNRLPVIVPCHRVIAGDGSLGGFAGGLELKKRLLGMEAKSTKA
jgi:methylated-DNA-[protein]-cysteine S-methyltransferase